MNKNLLIASAITAGTFALYYVLKNKAQMRKSVKQIAHEQSRHLTNVFAKAKHS